jgi:hypothetical protein
MNRRSTGRFFVGILLPMLLAPVARADWSFVMLGDTRGHHDMTNGFGNDIIQLMAGNGGAPLSPAGGSHDPGVDVLYTNDDRYGFALATVGTNSMTIEYHLLNPSDGHWSTASYTTTIMAVTPVPEPTCGLLLAAALLGLAPFTSRRCASDSAPAAPPTASTKELP